MDLSALESCFPSRSLTNIYYINSSVPFIFLFIYLFIFLLCIFLLDQELSWTWLHRSCRSLNIGGFSNNLTINQFYLFVSFHKTLSFTHTLRSHLTHYCSGDLGTLSLGILYHTCNATKVARESTVFFFFTKL